MTGTTDEQRQPRIAVIGAGPAGIGTGRELLPAQPGDVEETFADIASLTADTGYLPKVSIERGLHLFARWYIDYYQKK